MHSLSVKDAVNLILKIRKNSSKKERKSEVYEPLQKRQNLKMKKDKLEHELELKSIKEISFSDKELPRFGIGTVDFHFLSLQKKSGCFKTSLKKKKAVKKRVTA